MSSEEGPRLRGSARPQMNAMRRHEEWENAKRLAEARA